MENKLIRKQIEGNESFPFVERTMKYGGAVSCTILKHKQIN